MSPLANVPYPAIYLPFLVIHIASGFVGMYGGLVPLFTRKGGKAHRKWGLIFTWAMGIAAITAFPLAGMRNDPFQAVIGVFSGYLTLFGYRVLRRCEKGKAFPALDGGAALIGAVTFLAVTTWSAWGLVAMPTAPEARAGAVFGILGLIIVGRDIQGLLTKNDSFRRRILDHILATSLAVTSAFSAFLNTQFYRLTHVTWTLDKKMLLPLVVALPLLAYWVPVWANRLRTEQSTADILRNSGAESTEWERVRALGIAEGISFLLLVGVAVPLKRIGGHPEFVRVMGSLHGALFILYVVAVLLAVRPLRWNIKTTALALIAAVLPFGTFAFDYWQDRQRKTKQETPANV